MFWPFVLPFKITFWTFAAIVAAVTARAPSLRLRRGKAFLISTLCAVLAFVPSCTGIMSIVDGMRFGRFDYASFDDVNDFRAERYLPLAASTIEMHKHANGYRARYTITKAEFEGYLDHLWDEYGEYSAVERGGFFDEGATATPGDFEQTFGDLRWPPLKNAVIYYSPTEGDGGGATYYFDSKAGIATQRTGYW